MTNRVLHTYFIISLLLLIGHNTMAQNNGEQTAIANRYFAEKDYLNAENEYFNILESDSSSSEIKYKYARSLQLQNKYNQAYTQYKLIITNYTNFPTEVYFYLAETSNTLKKYNEAINEYSKYIKDGKDDKLRRIAEQEIISIKLIISSKNDSNEITIIHLPPPINGPYSEFNPVQLSSNKLVFSRYYPQFTDSIETVFSQNYLADIFVAKQSISGWKKPYIFSEKLSSNKYFTANVTFTKNKREVYFTRCIDNGGKIGSCKIYHSRYKNGKWNNPKKLDLINKPDYTSTHPNIVEMDEYRILYFSSNIPNGFGGNDIWYSIIRNGKIEKPQNAGSKINTKGDELTPYYDMETQTLFFSSNTHDGYGDFDIFRISGALSSFNNLKNMGNSINSTANDLYYIKGIEEGTAYFSSNREGSYYHDNMQNCCTDIYMAQQQINEENTIEEIPNNTDSLTTDTIVLAIKKLLPLSLYFENDKPDSKSTKTYTNRNYEDLLEEYIKAKNTYKKEYSKGLNTDEALIAEQQIEDFFNDKVENGFINLKRFIDLLTKELEQGKHVRIKIKGYASPLNSPEYNLALSKRRISSLKNFINDYNNGYFKKYTDDSINDSLAKLTIYENALGASTSTGLVSDNPNDKRNSIYSQQAALQRKIQIVMYSSNDKDILNNKEYYPELKWKQNIINIGNIKKGDNKSKVIYFNSVGRSELELMNFIADCKCIQIQNPLKTIQPGNKGKIYILVSTKGLDTGAYQQVIEVETNELSEKSRFVLKFNITD